MNDPLYALYDKAAQRTVNALRRDDGNVSGVLRRFRSGDSITLDELARIPDARLLKIQGFGRRSLADLRRVIAWEPPRCPQCGALQPPAEGAGA